MNWFIPGCFSEGYRSQALCLCGSARADPGADNWGCRSSLGKNFRVVGRKWPQLRNPQSTLVTSCLNAGGDVEKLLALQVQVRDLRADLPFCRTHPRPFPYCLSTDLFVA